MKDQVPSFGLRHEMVRVWMLSFPKVYYSRLTDPSSQVPQTYGFR